MIREVLFLSVAQMRHVKPSRQAVVVSVLDRSEEWERPDFSGFLDSLCMSFEDTAEETKLASAWQWPDNPSDNEHARFAQGRGERIPTLDDAVSIAAFIGRYHASPEDLTLYAHCHGGVSRSAAIAVFVSVWLAAPIPDLSLRSADFFNPRVLRLLNKAVGRR